MTIREQRNLLLRCFMMTSMAIEVFASHDIVALISDSVSISCTPNFTVTIQWYFNSPYNYVYAGGQFRGLWKERCIMETDNTTGMYIIQMSNVNLEDAGQYRCVEEKSGLQISSTNLTVLESSPVCSSNMNHDGFVGPNECDFQQEDMTFHCAVSYNGDPPQMVWRSTTDDKPRNSSICEDQANSRNCSLTLKPYPSFHGTVFTCEIETSGGRPTPFNCSTKEVKVQYFLAKLSSLKRSRLTLSDNVTCDVQSSLNIYYKWTLKTEEMCRFVGSTRTIPIDNHGEHQCEATYAIRNVPCTFRVDTFYSPPIDASDTIIPVVLIVLVVLFVIILCFLICHMEKRIQYFEWPKLIQTIRTEASKTEDKSIKGFALLNYELYIITQQESTVEVYDAASLEHLRSFTLEELTTPEDVCECVKNNCLYISENKPESNEILRVDPTGEVITKWRTGEVFGRLSVSSGATVVVVIFDKSKFMEYSSDGIHIRTVDLSLLKTQRIMHALKLKSGNFLIVYEYHRDFKYIGLLWVVYAVSNDLTNVLLEAKRWPSSQVSIPSCVTMDREGSIIVADAVNGFILLHGTNRRLRPTREIIPKEYRITTPTWIHLDELNGRLYVIDDKQNERALYVFRVATIQDYRSLYQRICHYFKGCTPSTCLTRRHSAEPAAVNV